MITLVTQFPKIGNRPARNIDGYHLITDKLDESFSIIQVVIKFNF
jgi:hypothetical protein